MWYLLAWFVAGIAAPAAPPRRRPADRRRISSRRCRSLVALVGLVRARTRRARAADRPLAGGVRRERRRRLVRDDARRQAAPAASTTRCSNRPPVAYWLMVVMARSLPLARAAVGPAAARARRGSSSLTGAVRHAADDGRRRATTATSATSSRRRRCSARTRRGTSPIRSGSLMDADLLWAAVDLPVALLARRPPRPRVARRLAGAAPFAPRVAGHRRRRSRSPASALVGAARVLRGDPISIRCSATAPSPNSSGRSATTPTTSWHYFAPDCASRRGDRRADRRRARLVRQRGAAARGGRARRSARRAAGT